MTAIVLAGCVALAAIMLYAIFGGADFGGGVWDLLASGPRRVEQREAVGLAMGPVWETNHIWLIFALVTLFTCFPPVFAKLSVALFLPLSFALVGIIMRGAAFAFRGPSTRDLLVHRVWGQVFGIASLLTPFFFGAAAAAVATGTFSWFGPFSLLVGLFAVTICAQIAGTFMCAETKGRLQDDFRLRATIATFAVAAAGLLAIVVSALLDPPVFSRLGHGWLWIAFAMLTGLIVLWRLQARDYIVARAAVCIETAAILGGWYAAQLPFLEHDLGLPWKAAPQATLVTYLWIVVAGAVALIPSLWLLFSIFKREPVDLSAASK